MVSLQHPIPRPRASCGLNSSLQPYKDLLHHLRRCPRDFHVLPVVTGRIGGTNELFVRFLTLTGCIDTTSRSVLLKATPGICSRTSISIHSRLMIDRQSLPSGSLISPQSLSMEPRLTPTEVAVHRLRLPISPQRRMSCPPNGGMNNYRCGKMSHEDRCRHSSVSPGAHTPPQDPPMRAHPRPDNLELPSVTG